MAQKAAPREAPVDKATEDKLKVVRDLNAARTAADSQTLAANVVNLWAVRDILYSGVPAAGTSDRKVYDEAVKKYGGSKADPAVAVIAVNSALAVAISNLEPVVKSKADAGPSQKKLVDLLGAIMDGLGDPETARSLSAFTDITDTVSNLRINTMRTEPAPEPAAEEAAAPGATALKPGELVLKASVSQPLRIMPPAIYDMGRIHYLSGTGEGKSYAVGGTLSGDQLLNFKSESAARTFVGEYATALATWWDNRTVDCGRLLSALDGIANPAIKADPRFGQAVTLLQAGKGEEALKTLMQIDALKGPLSAANNITVVKMSGRAVSVFTGEGTVVFDLFGDRSEYERYLARPGNDPFGRAFVELAVKVAFDVLRASGKASTGSIDLANMKFNETKSEAVTFNGIAASVTPQLALSTSAGSRPLKIIAHATFGYRQFDSEKPITVMNQDGTTTEKTMGSKSAYLGLWGFEFQFPTRGGQSSVFAVERIGTGVVGTDMRNALAYVTFSINPKTTDDTVRHQFLFTPMYAGFMTQSSSYSAGEYQPRPGLEAAYSFMKDASSGLWSISPYTRAEVNTSTKVWTVDGGLRLSYSWHPAWQVYGNVGYLGEVGGQKYDQLPTNVGPGVMYGGVGIRVTPWATVPTRTDAGGPKDVRVSQARDSSLNKRMREATELLSSGDSKEISGTKGTELAKELAGLLEGQLVMSGQAGTFSSNKDYIEGMRLLRAGDLKGGLETLSKVPGLLNR